ncbi:unnamed protein product [Clavelina lepadiformis]|uniref:Rho guanine nucleotide exchange factor 3 n=1 Tax=Clavelina lepadiformis TaxID=159417 RepID=A0ABP0GDA9_CLALP
MKMKRFFANKHKKKKSTDNSETIFDSKLLELSTDTDISGEFYEAQSTQKTSKKKQKQQKKKLKAQKSAEACVVQNPAALEAGHTFLTANGANVVLRRGSNTLDVRPPAGPGRKRDEFRIPGSESSSRTASSASSQSLSNQRWSARRPWSLVESLREQSLTEFNESPNNHNCDNNQHNISAPPDICTLPRGIALNDSSLTLNSSGKEQRVRTFTLDFSFFRKLRRHSGSSDKKSRPESEPFASNSEVRGSFRLKMKGKKFKNSKSTSSASVSSRNSASSLTPITYCDAECADVDQSATNGDCSNYDPTEADIPEEQDCCDWSSFHGSTEKRSHSSSSSASKDTVISISDTPNKFAFAQKETRETSENQCEVCANSHRGSGESSECCCAETGTILSIVDTDPVVSTRQVVRRRSQTTNVSPASSNYSSNVQTVYSASVRDVYRASTEPSAEIEPAILYGGSLKCIPRTPPSQLTSRTLPKRIGRNNVVVRIQDIQKSSAMYASSPQLSSPCRRSLELSNLTRPRSSTVRFSEYFSEIPTTPEESDQFPASQLKNENAMVDSPIKRAIGYPGVVLRRHQNRRNKKATQLKTSSAELLRERRAKFAMSLNMEDLPTYGQIQDDDLKWRTLSLFSAETSGSRIVPKRCSVAGVDRQQLRTALLYQRCASHCTSVDDISAISFMLGADQSIEDLNNMDDDEFLDLYLSARDSSSNKRDSPRTSQTQEPSSKRVKNLRKSVASFANLISPGKPGRNNKIQRSSSFKESSANGLKPYRPPGSQNGNSVTGGNTPGRRSTSNKSRRSKLWCETFDHSGLDESEVKRQEAIFELYQGECVMVQDLKMAKQTYRDSMVTLKMLNEDEVTRIFGTLDCLLPLHEDLLARLERTRKEDGCTDGVGSVFIEWFPTLSPYNEYCANQADAKETLDSVVGREHRVRDFLQRCLESPFSRKLNLWSYLDLPRSRLVKYPLLLKNILKATPAHHEDAALLEKALAIINEIIVRVDDLTGERQSRFFQNKLEYLDDKQRCPEVEESRNVICQGQLKGSRGTKLHVLLFDLVLVLTRNATRGDKLTYQVYRQPLPLRSLTVETEETGKLSGSFRGGILNSDKAKHSFRVRSEELNIAYTLVASDEHDKKQWINSLQEAINKFRSNAVQTTANRSPIARRAGSEKSALDKPGEKNVTVKRSSSVRSEGGNSNAWYRNRSMTLTGQGQGHSFRRNSKDKDFIGGDLKKKSRSPLSFRRNSKPVVTKTDSSDSLELNKPIDDSFTCRRSRSLTSSPINFLASLPKRSSQRGSSRISRSESCTTKPPTGRVSQLTHAYNLRSQSGTASKTLPTSPRLASARSTPDLSILETKSHSQFEPMETLAEVKKRFAPSPIPEPDHSSSLDRLSPDIEVSVQAPTPVDTPSTSTQNSPNVVKPPHASDVSHFMMDSPDDPAASNTSQNFPIVEEDALSPGYKSVSSLPSIHPSLSTSIIIMPTIALTNSSSVPMLSSLPKNDFTQSTSCCTSSESLADVSPLMDDVTMILDNAVERLSQDDAMSEDNDLTISEVDMTTDADLVVLDTLNEIIANVCDSQPIFPFSSEVNCHEDYITITAEDGLPWRGNDIEMMV